MPKGPWRTVLVALLALGVAQPGLPSAAADDYRLAFPADFQSALLATDVPRFGPAAAQVRSQIDNAPGVGNQDGTVSEAELKIFEDETKAFFNRGSVTSSALTVDGRKADSGIMDSVDFEGAEGPTASEEPIIVHYVQRLYFNVAAVDVHKVGVQTAALSANMTMTATVVAPPGFGITNITGLPGPVFISDDRTLMKFEAGAVAGDTVVTLQRGAQVATSSTPPPSGGQTSWVPIVVLALLAAALVGWMRIKR